MALGTPEPLSQSPGSKVSSSAALSEQGQGVDRDAGRLVLDHSCQEGPDCHQPWLSALMRRRLHLLGICSLHHDLIQHPWVPSLIRF